MKPNRDVSTPIPWRIILFQFAISIPVLMTIPVVSAGMTAALARPLAAIPVSSSILRWSIWGCAAPLIYAVWLLLCLAICALDVQSRRWYRGLRKVPRVSTTDGITKYYPAISLYLRMKFIYSLPLTATLLWIPGLRWLVLWSYSPSAHLGLESNVIGLLYDPDLTEIGEGAIVGSGVSVVAHSVTTNSDGSKVLSTAPIVIGPRAVISGQSLISLGVTIGADSIVEPMSHVAAFTQIPAGEVWGGTPAVFRRKRFEKSLPVIVAGRTSGSTTASQPDIECDVRRVVATALNLPFDTVSPEFSADACAAWDSLGQMAIASALHSLLGVGIPTEKSFQLRSVPEIVELLKSGSAQRASAEEIALPSNPDLLPLLNHTQVTRMLAQQASQIVPPLTLPMTRVIVAATFTAEPLSSALSLWCNAFGIPVELESAGFNQIPQALLSPESPFRQNSDGVNVVLARPEDLVTDELVAQVLSAISQFSADFPNLLLVANLPPVVSGDCPVRRDEVRRMRGVWERSISGVNGIQLLDFAGIIEQIGTAAAANADGDRIAGIPYSADVYAELGIAIARQVRSCRRARAKVLALDCDGVLWGNVLGEDGFDGIALGGEGPGRQFQLFQHSILQLKEKGVLLAVVSRNELADVRQVFDSHPGMVLREKDIAAWGVNWLPKSQNLKEIARELNLGLESFVFVDDDSVNQMEVQVSVPDVTVLPLPPNPADYGPTLERLWCFDSPNVTMADAQRTTMIRQEHDRRQLQQNSEDLESYLSSLELQVVMRLATADDMPRVAQLTQKTNQFNLSLKRRSEAELCSLPSSHAIYVVDVADRLGPYGLVGVCILIRPSNPSDIVKIDTLLISCRALGRGVEGAMLYGMREFTRSFGSHMLIAELVEGPRNQPIVEFLRHSGFRQTDPNQFQLDPQTELVLPRHISWTGPLRHT